MTNLFAITTASNTILLDSQNRAHTTFIVTNVSGRPLSSRASLSMHNPAVASWLTLLGETERDLSVGGSAQYIVDVDVPKIAAPGTYSFRLDMLEITAPDETLTQGPTVSFAVRSPTLEKPKPRIRRWVLVLAIAVIILIIAYIVFVIFGI